MHSVVVGDDGEPDPEQQRAVRVRWSPPENEVGALVRGPVVIVATDDAAAVLGSAVHYSAGVLLSVQLSRRQEARGARYGRGMPDEPLVGVELADGRRVAVDTYRLDERDDGVVMTAQGGGGGGRSFAFSYWLSPAPPAGDLTVVVHAVDHGLPEGRAVLAADDLAAARSRVVELWPWVPDPPDSHEPPPRPTPPPGGWFDHESE
ncbi:hypothetical protein [Cellulomonas sp. PhB150]|uniref:hypothetical protein n=1 Tax=Cellulomonas sp. PhB150 TaxID=2485188 RepID=UPI000F46DEC2|nr:hypothetical protein [Cellulomonas sp. PhB150]